MVNPGRQRGCAPLSSHASARKNIFLETNRCIARCENNLVPYLSIFLQWKQICKKRTTSLQLYWVKKHHHRRNKYCLRSVYLDTGGVHGSGQLSRAGSGQGDPARPVTQPVGLSKPPGPSRTVQCDLPTRPDSTRKSLET